MEPGDNRLHQQLQSARERLQDLYRRAEASPAQRELLEEALVELSISLEELQVSVEEMRQYNDELAAAQEETAVEHRRYRELFDFAPQAIWLPIPGETSKMPIARRMRSSECFRSILPTNP